MIARVMALLLLVTASAHAGPAGSDAQVVSDERGHKLSVGGGDFFVRGMNWGYVPVGENFAYSLWEQPDRLIERVLHRDMDLLRDMGVNLIRQSPGIPPRWIAWIFEHYHIYTAINPFLGRYGATIDGVWIAHIDYGDPRQRRALLGEVVEVVDTYRGTPGVLLWILGNENNYGLHWTSPVEAVPGKEDVARARVLYTLYGEAIAAIKARDARPVAIANGDLQYVELIKEHCRGLDILGTNVYRGASARDLYQVVRDRLGIPVMYTEFGADAFDARRGREDALAQAEYLRSQWRELYENAYGQGAGTAIGGMVFQWADGWWKHGQTDYLEVHDTSASWPNAAYPHDYVEGENNMNEEWFGISAIDPPDEDGFYEVTPRPAYYVLRAIFALDPYAEGTDQARIAAHFSTVRARDYAAAYDAGRARADVEALRAFRISDFRARFDTVGSAGSSATERGAGLVLDHTESFYVDFEFRPLAKASASLSLNFVGNVAENRLDPLSFENRRRARPGDPTPLLREPGEETDLERFAIYRASLEADYDLATLRGYYRSGHGHWGYEGDFFGLYREAHYGSNIDTYQANAPFGAELTVKGALDGLKLAFGPEVYWGANPAVIAKYRRALGPLVATVVHQEDIAVGSGGGASSVVPLPVTRRTAVAVESRVGAYTLEVGALFAGSGRVGERFVAASPTSGPGYRGSGYDVFEDQLRWRDTLGGKLVLTRDAGWVRFYAEAGLQGLVADGGGDPTIRITRWSHRATGRGNQVHGAGGLALGVGPVTIAPHVLFQRPLVGPNPAIADAVDPGTGVYHPGIRPRNLLDDPFAVLDNRETLGGELLLVFDPTPATWFWAWDNDVREDAPLAGSLDLSYRHRPTSRDANTAIIASGERIAFGKAPPASDAWEARLRLVGAPARRLRLRGELFVGRDEALGESPRLRTRFGGGATIRYGLFSLWTELRFRDWGPYDYYRDFDLTYPLQAYSDLSYGVRARSLGLGDVRLGLRGQFRTVDGSSAGYVEGSPRTGREYEVSSYLAVNL
jgi:hypothetical protein